MRLLLIVSSAMLALWNTSCAGPGAGTSKGLVGRAASLPTVSDLDGNEVSLYSLLHDRAEMERGSPNYLLLVNSHSKCDVTPKFMNDLCEVWDDFVALKCRCACVVLEKEGAPAEAWKDFTRLNLFVYRDPGGRCLEFYVKKTMPALTLVDRFGTVVFHCEGYLAPKTLADKIKKADFRDVETKGG